MNERCTSREPRERIGRLDQSDGRQCDRPLDHPGSHMIRRPDGVLVASWDNTGDHSTSHVGTGS